MKYIKDITRVMKEAFSLSMLITCVVLAVLVAAFTSSTLLHEFGEFFVIFFGLWLGRYSMLRDLEGDQL